MNITTIEPSQCQQKSVTFKKVLGCILVISIWLLAVYLNYFLNQNIRSSEIETAIPAQWSGAEVTDIKPLGISKVVLFNMDNKPCFTFLIKTPFFDRYSIAWPPVPIEDLGTSVKLQDFVATYYVVITPTGELNLLGTNYFLHKGIVLWNVVLLMAAYYGAIRIFLYFRHRKISD